jgi:hypothetical protein
MRARRSLGDVRAGGRAPDDRPDIVIRLDDHPSDHGDVVAAGPDEPPQWTNWGQRLMTPLLLLGLAGVVFAFRGQALSGQPDDQPSTAPGTSVPLRQALPPFGPGLIAPLTGRPGQPITVVGFQDLSLCGQPELRFDDAPVAHQVDATARPSTPGLLAVFMVMQVPSTATPGQHRIRLWGPAHGGRRSVCGDVPVHQEELGVVDIEITP